MFLSRAVDVLKLLEVPLPAVWTGRPSGGDEL
jgi:hypothetical protein